MTEDRRLRVRVDLTGVPETLLWNLYHRASAARDPRVGLTDPRAIEIVDRIDYAFERVAGHGGYARQWHALRVHGFDHAVRRFLAVHPAGTVVALGEGLESQFWRTDNGRVSWLTVDLPETIAVRQQLLDDGPRQRTIACSALDERWTEEIDPSNGVLITAQGLLMYFTPSEVDQLVNMSALRFPGAGLVFDAVPAWMLRRRGRWTERDNEGYQPPAWLWGIDGDELQRLAALPQVAELTVLPAERGTGFVFGVLVPALQKLRPVRSRLPIFPILQATFVSGHQSPPTG